MVRAASILLLQCFVYHTTTAQQLVDKAAEKFMQTGNIAGMFMAVVKNDTVVYQKNFGFADSSKIIRVTDTTCFELGSIAKAFTADMIYELQHKKLLKVTDPISNYFIGAPESWTEIKISHLLSHTSGIRNYLMDPRFYAATYFTGNQDTAATSFFNHVTTDSMVQLFYSLPLDFAPGSNWAYSNTGYYLLGKIIEKVSRQNYFEAVKSSLLSAGMYRTKPNGTAAKEGCLATGFLYSDGIRKAARMLTSPYAFSAGAWATTGTDMIRYLKAIHSRKLAIDQTGYDWRELTAFSHLPVTYHGGRFYTTYHGQKVIFHNGGTPGFSSSWIYVPAKNISVIILLNRQDYAPIDQLAWHVLAQYEPYLQYPVKKITTPEVEKYVKVVRQFLRALKDDTSFPRSFSKPLTVFVQSENGKGLWRWIFEQGIPSRVDCVDKERTDNRTIFRFRLSTLDDVHYRLTLVVNQKKEIVQLQWF
jgi:CubicO group peptidase (beta-lactamase class C family)